MGYETQLFIGRRTDIAYFNTETSKPDSSIVWFQEYATIDLCKIEGLDIPPNLPKVFIFGSDGDKQIKEDRYGDPLVAIPPNIVLSQLKVKDLEYGDYRRIKWAINLIEHMVELSGELENLEIVSYGH